MDNIKSRIGALRDQHAQKKFVHAHSDFFFKFWDYL